MKGRRTLLDGCCTRCMMYSVYAVLGVCCTRCMLYSVCAVLGVCCTRCMLYSVYAVLGVCCTRCTLYWLYAVLGVCCTRCQLMIIHQQKTFRSGRSGSVRVDALRQSRQTHPGGRLLRARRQYDASRCISPSDRDFAVSSRSVGVLL